MIQIQSFYAFNELRNLSYVISNQDNGAAWVIDPYEADPIIDYIKKHGLVLKGILNTHQHFDHIRGNASLKNKFNAPELKLSHQAEIQLDELTRLEVIDSPGHTLDHQTFLIKKTGELHPYAMFSGDTLFASGVGNCKHGGDPAVLYATICKLKELAPSITIFPGHEYRKRNLEFALSVEPSNDDIKCALEEEDFLDPLLMCERPTTLEEELRVNPFLRLSSNEILRNLNENKIDSQESFSSEKEVFLKLRSLRDLW